MIRFKIEGEFWFVQSHLMSLGLKLFFADELAAEAARRILRHNVEKQKRQQHHTEDDGDGEDEFSNEVGKHIYQFRSASRLARSLVSSVAYRMKPCP